MRRQHADLITAWNELPSRSTYYEFARAIEAAHGIGVNHE